MIGKIGQAQVWSLLHCWLAELSVWGREVEAAAVSC